MTDHREQKEWADRSRFSCVWAARNNGVTCAEATTRSVFWCWACKRAAASPLPSERKGP